VTDIVGHWAYPDPTKGAGIAIPASRSKILDNGSVLIQAFILLQNFIPEIIYYERYVQLRKIAHGGI
jgi:hypothetical protein